MTKMHDDLLAKIKASTPNLSSQMELLSQAKCKRKGGTKSGPVGKGKQQKKQPPAKNVFLSDETINPLNIPTDLVNFNCY